MNVSVPNPWTVLVEYRIDFFLFGLGTNCPKNGAAFQKYTEKQQKISEMAAYLFRIIFGLQVIVPSLGGNPKHMSGTGQAPVLAGLPPLC